MKPTNPILLDAFGNAKRSSSVPYYTFISESETTLHSLELLGEGDVVVSYTHYGEKMTDTYSNVDSLLLNVDSDAGTLVRVKGYFTTIDCHGNSLSHLDIRDMGTLSTLDCSQNVLQTLSTHDCGALVNLNCSQNILTELDVSGASTLDTLICAENQLSELDLTTLTDLGNIICHQNDLPGLDLSNSPLIVYIDCHQNRIERILFNDLAKPFYIDCSENQLRDFEVRPEWYNLYHFNCAGNIMNSLIIAPELSELTYINCSWSEYLSALDIFGLPKLEQLICSHSPISHLTIDCEALHELDISGETSGVKELSIAAPSVSLIRFNAKDSEQSELIADLIEHSTVDDGTVYLDSSDEYYSIVASAATAKGWTIEAL